MELMYAPRLVETTIPCPRCGKPVNVERSCHEAWIHCPGCGKFYQLKDFIPKAVMALVEFLDLCMIDRI